MSQSVARCENFIRSRSKNDRLIMIASGRLGQAIFSNIHNLRHVISIYAYCIDKKVIKKELLYIKRQIQYHYFVF